MTQYLIALGLLVAVGAFAQDEQPEIKYNVEFRPRYYNVLKGAGGDEPGSGYDGSGAFIEQRSLLGLSFRRGERIGGQFTLLHNAIWGRTRTQDTDVANAGFGPNTGDTAAGTPNGIGNNENMVLVNEAWGWWKATDSITLRLGRSGLQIADGSVFSRNDWEQVPTSFEGGFIHWDTDSVVMNAIAVKLEELPRRTRGASDVNDPEANFYLFSFDGKMLPEWLKLLNGHFVQINTSQVTTPNLPSAGGAPTQDIIDNLGKNIQRLGVAARGDYRGFGFGLSGAYEQGKMSQKPAEEINVQAHMMDLDFGYTFPTFINLRLYANFHMDSGDFDVLDRKPTESSVGPDNKFTRYNPLFYDAHKYAGLMDIVGWGNLTYYQVGVTASPFEKAEMGLHFLSFERTSERDVVTAGRMGAELFSGFQPDATRRDDKHIGQELDLTFDYNFEGGFSTGMLLGLFFPGSYIKDGTNSITGTTSDERLGENIRQVMVQGRYAF